MSKSKIYLVVGETGYGEIWQADNIEIHLRNIPEFKDIWYETEVKTHFFNLRERILEKFQNGPVFLVYCGHSYQPPKLGKIKELIRNPLDDYDVIKSICEDPEIKGKIQIVILYTDFTLSEYPELPNHVPCPFDDQSNEYSLIKYYGEIPWDQIIPVVRKVIQKNEEDKLIELSELFENEIIGKSPAILSVLKKINSYAKSNSSVLILGETGTGKELVAVGLHKKSKRAKENFIAVNCGAIPETLIESELFGHEKGSFTGATTQKKGKFEIAHKGTLFLDEVADLSIGMQVKLLRVLDKGEFYRVGGNQNIKVDVRIIAATNKDLHALVKKGVYREDLYQRLKGDTIRVPPLVERREDIKLLIKHFLNTQNEEFNTAIQISKQAIKILEKEEWRGNIRELQNFIRSLAGLVDGNIITEDMVMEKINENKIIDEKETKIGDGKLDEIKKAHIEAVLIKNSWNKTRTARELNIDMKTLTGKIIKYDLKK